MMGQRLGSYTPSLTVGLPSEFLSHQLVRLCGAAET